jgi:excisionase family DNA binding protein
MKSKLETASDKKPSGESAFYTVKEYAKRLRISEKSVRRLIDKKKLIAHKFGNMWRISVADALAFERANRIS